MEDRNPYHLLLIPLLGLVLFGYFYAIHLIQIWEINTDFQNGYFAALTYLYFHNPYVNVVQDVITQRIMVEANSNLSAPLLMLVMGILSKFFSYERLFYLWCLLSSVALLGGVYLTLRCLTNLSLRHYFSAHVLILLLASFTLVNYSFGQCGLLFMFGLLAFALLYQRQCLLMATLILGIMTAFKLFFLFFCLLFIARRQFSWLLLYLAFSAFFFLAPLAQNLKASLMSYYAVTHHINWYCRNWNGSFLGVFIRLFGAKGHSIQNSLLTIPHLAYGLYGLAILTYCTIAYRAFRHIKAELGCIGVGAGLM